MNVAMRQTAVQDQAGPHFVARYEYNVNEHTPRP